MNTYINGYKLKVEKDITNKSLVQLCKDLEQSFGEGYKFTPEPITEGGIEWVEWPNKEKNMYKTMRIRFNDCGKYPWIKNDTLEKWITGEEFIITPITGKSRFGNNEKSNNTIVSTFLKAFHNAPKWTKKELDIFEKCLANIGMKKKCKYAYKTNGIY